MIGRGTRINPGKKNLLIVDFLWHSTRHLLIKPAHLIAKSERIAADVRDDGDLIEMCELAEDRHLRQLEKEMAKLANRKSRLIDPLDLGTLLDDLDTAEYVPMTNLDESPITEEQKKRLEKAGLNLDAIKGRGHADHIMEVLDRRRADELGTLKQVRILKKYGHADAPFLSFAECNRRIGALASSGWRMPKPEPLLSGAAPS